MIIETNESKNTVDTLCFMDFDGTLIDSPLPDEGKIAWSEFYKIPYPHKGWWGREESLDLNVFNIMPNEIILNKLKEIQTNKNTVTYLLTNRMTKLKDQVMAVLKKNNIHLDYYSLKMDNKEKSDRIKDFLKNYPDIKKIIIFDDDFDKILDFVKLKHELSNIKFDIFQVENGKIVANFG